MFCHHRVEFVKKTSEKAPFYTTGTIFAPFARKCRLRIKKQLTKPIFILKKIFILLTLFLPLIATAQESSVGLRLGDPLSLSYRTFLDDRISIEAMIGRGGLNGPQYYRRIFENNPPTPDSFYLGHSVTGNLALNFRGAIHEDLSDEIGITEGRLIGFLGAGIQMRTNTLDFSYSNATMPPVPLMERRTNFDLGPEAFGGGEYYFQDLPMSVFLEVGVFLELLDRFGHLRLQGAIGVRYLF